LSGSGGDNLTASCPLAVRLNRNRPENTIDKENKEFVDFFIVPDISAFVKIKIYPINVK